jgi:uncharacterized protein (DUF427 family)
MASQKRSATPDPARESVWDYPRPPALERTPRLIEVHFADVVIASSSAAWRVLETSHPPVYYIPPEDVRLEYLKPARGASWCEWKGQAAYYDVRVGDRVAERAAWTYPEPTSRFAPIAHHVAFYPGRMDACFVDGERVRAQPGDFYGGWITSDLDGPFKGVPGSQGW